MSFLAGFAIKMQEGEYDAEPTEEPKVCDMCVGVLKTKTSYFITPWKRKGREGKEGFKYVRYSFDMHR